MKKKGKGQKGQKKRGPGGPGRGGGASRRGGGKEEEEAVAQQASLAAGLLQEALGALTVGPPAPAPEDLRDWAWGLPWEVLARVGEIHIAQAEAAWAAWLKRDGCSEEEIREEMEERAAEPSGLFALALVCKGWRAAQLKVGARLRSRAGSDVMMPGRVELAKWALAEGCPREDEEDPKRTLACVAASHGHLEMVRFLCKNADEGGAGFAMDEGVMHCAAWSGSQELVQRLWVDGCSWDEGACAGAAEGGRLEILKWLRLKRCPWDEDVIAAASANGHLEVLQWALAEGCPWDDEACTSAAEGGQLEVLQWLQRKLLPRVLLRLVAREERVVEDRVHGRALEADQRRRGVASALVCVVERVYRSCSPPPPPRAPSPLRAPPAAWRQKSSRGPCRSPRQGWRDAARSTRNRRVRRGR